MNRKYISHEILKNFNTSRKRFCPYCKVFFPFVWYRYSECVANCGDGVDWWLNLITLQSFRQEEFHAKCTNFITSHTYRKRMWKCRKYHKSIEIPKPKSRTLRRYSIFACWTIITCNSFIAFEFGISPHLRPQFSEIRLRIDMTGEYEPSRLKYIGNHNNAALSSKPINTFVKIEPFLNMCQAMRRVYISKGFVVLVIRQSKRIKKK